MRNLSSSYRHRGNSRRFSIAALVIWLVIIVLLACAAVVSWWGTISIFGQPEKPFSYSILTKMRKLDSPQRFESNVAPRGDFLPPEKLLERYGEMTTAELAEASTELLRNYIRNFKLMVSTERVPYVVGEFDVLDSFELSTANIITPGVVALMQSKAHPTVLVEKIFPIEEKAIPTLQRALLSGNTLELRPRRDFAAIINIARLDDERLQFTVVPIDYATYTTTTASGTFSLEPPRTLNLAAGLPVLATDTVRQATEKFESKKGAPAAQGTQLVRVARAVAAGKDDTRETNEETPPPAPTPEPPTSAATPVSETLVSATQDSISSTLPTLPIPPTDQSDQTDQTDPSDALQAQPTPEPSEAEASAQPDTTWPLYEPRRMPKGKLIRMQDVTDVAASGGLTGRTYLQGNFTVDMTSANRAVLTSSDANQRILGIPSRDARVRVIVDFPEGITPPAEGTRFSRDDSRPFEIRSMRRDASGTVTVYAREVTVP